MKFKSRLQVNANLVGAKVEGAKASMYGGMAKLAPAGSLRNSFKKKALQSVNSSVMFSDQAKKILNRKR
jgi:hypothetical protein